MAVDMTSLLTGRGKNDDRDNQRLHDHMGYRCLVHCASVYTLLATMVSGGLDHNSCSCGVVRVDLLVMKLSSTERFLLLRLKDSKLRGAASISCNQFEKTAEDLIKLKLVEKYGFGYRITEKGMKA